MPTFSSEIRDGDMHVLRVTGELDISNREELRDALAAVDAGVPRVLIDFCECRYFDTTVLSELVRFYKARHDTQNLSLSAPEGLARWVLRITSIDQLLPIVECTHGRHSLTA